VAEEAVDAVGSAEAAEEAATVAEEVQKRVAALEELEELQNEWSFLDREWAADREWDDSVSNDLPRVGIAGPTPKKKAGAEGSAGEDSGATKGPEGEDNVKKKARAEGSEDKDSGATKGPEGPEGEDKGKKKAGAEGSEDEDIGPKLWPPPPPPAVSKQARAEKEARAAEKHNIATAIAWAQVPPMGALPPMPDPAADIDTEAVSKVTKGPNAKAVAGNAAYDVDPRDTDLTAGLMNSLDSLAPRQMHLADSDSVPHPDAVCTRFYDHCTLEGTGKKQASAQGSEDGDSGATKGPEGEDKAKRPREAPHRKSAESEARLKVSCAAHKLRRVAARQAHARSYGGFVGAADPAPTVNPPEQQSVPKKIPARLKLKRVPPSDPTNPTTPPTPKRATSLPPPAPDGAAATAAPTSPLVGTALENTRAQTLLKELETCDVELAKPGKVQYRKCFQYREKCFQYRVRAGSSGSSVAPVTPPDEDALAAVTAPIANVQHANPAITPIHQLSSNPAIQAANQAIQAANEAYWSAHSADAGSEPPSPRPYLEACLTCGSHNCICPGGNCHLACETGSIRLIPSSPDPEPPSPRVEDPANVKHWKSTRPPCPLGNGSYCWCDSCRPQPLPPPKAPLPGQRKRLPQHSLQAQEQCHQTHLTLLSMQARSPQPPAPACRTTTYPRAPLSTKHQLAEPPPSPEGADAAPTAFHVMVHDAPAKPPERLDIRNQTAAEAVEEFAGMHQLSERKAQQLLEKVEGLWPGGVHYLGGCTTEPFCISVASQSSQSPASPTNATLSPVTQSPASPTPTDGTDDAASPSPACPATPSFLHPDDVASPSPASACSSMPLVDTEVPSDGDELPGCPISFNGNDPLGLIINGIDESPTRKGADVP
jgi:hypothetical protein